MSSEPAVGLFLLPVKSMQTARFRKELIQILSLPYGCVPTSHAVCMCKTFLQWPLDSNPGLTNRKLLLSYKENISSLRNSK